MKLSHWVIRLYLNKRKWRVIKLFKYMASEMLNLIHHVSLIIVRLEMLSKSIQ
jgi:hypothetical protein